MRVHVTDHHGLGVAAKGIFQEVSQLGLAVTDVLALLGGRRVIQLGGGVVTQVVNDLAEDCQTFVNHTSLFDTHALSSSVLDALTASKINYVESGGFNMLLTGVKDLDHSNDCGKDSMRTRTLLVHSGLRDMTVP
jgi:hypothetical protein